ncbi:MAG: hypothetical protein ACT4ON_12455 [Bacteroidota bacterium]
MLTKRFLISWLAASAIMFFISYAWHGVFLTDYSRLSYPQEIFLIIAAIVYLILGFVVAKAIDAKLLEGHFKRKPVMKGAFSGAVCGFVFFLIATVVGVSFSTTSNVQHLLLDVTWQVIEQAIGGITVGIVHILVYDPRVSFED